MSKSGARFIKQTIANGASVSEGFDLEGDEVVGILTDAGWTAAALSFEAAINPKSGEAAVYGTGTYYAVHDDDGGGQVQVATAQMATANIVLTRDTILGKLKGFQHLRLRSGTTAAAVNQGATRTIYVIAQPQP